MPGWLYAWWERLTEQLDAPALAAVRFLRSFWGPPLLSGVLFYLSFAPVDWGWCMPVGWFVLLLSFRLRDGDRAGRQAFVADVYVFAHPASRFSGVRAFAKLLRAADRRLITVPRGTVRAEAISL